MIDYDKYGHCIMCHTNMILTRVVDGEEVTMLSPKYTEKEYLLDDGTKMRVAMCQKCYSHLKDNEDEYTIVMNNVYKGWEHETKLLVEKRYRGKHGKWDKERRDKYLNTMKDLNILTKTDKLNQSDLNRKFKEHKDKVEKDKKGK